jgi:uncharacterized protein YbjQ (UPF0145 family)
MDEDSLPNHEHNMEELESGNLEIHLYINNFLLILNLTILNTYLTENCCNLFNCSKASFYINDIDNLMTKGNSLDPHVLKCLHIYVSASPIDLQYITRDFGYISVSISSTQINPYNIQKSFKKSVSELVLSCEKARARVVSKLREKCHLLGANAVSGLKIDVVHTHNYTTIYTASGNAIIMNLKDNIYESQKDEDDIIPYLPISVNNMDRH